MKFNYSKLSESERKSCKKVAKKLKELKEKIDIIIPTWNSMPELEVCLSSILHNVPHNDIIIVDRDSNDGTLETAQKYDCTILNDTISLGSARMKGIQQATTDIILFIDSDISIPPEWYINMINWWATIPKTGMLFGRTVDTNKYGKIKKYKIQRDFKNQPYRILQKGRRGYTHNTFIKRDLIEDIDISPYNAWEDYLITQSIIEQGYNVIETKDTVHHIHHNINNAKVAWSLQGLLQVKKNPIEAFLYWYYYLYEGLRSAIHYKDIDMLTWGIKNWYDGFKLFTNKNPRGK